MSHFNAEVTGRKIPGSNSSSNSSAYIGYSNEQLRKEGNRILDRHQNSFTGEITHRKHLKDLNGENPDKILFFIRNGKI